MGLQTVGVGWDVHLLLKTAKIKTQNMFEMFAKRTPDPEEYSLYIVFVLAICNP